MLHAYRSQNKQIQTLHAICRHRCSCKWLFESKICLLASPCLLKCVRKRATNNSELRHVSRVSPPGSSRLPMFGIHEIWHLSTFRERVEKIHVLLKYDNNRYVAWRLLYTWKYLGEFFEWKIFQTGFVEKFKTHILCSIPYILEYNPHPFYSFRGQKIRCGLERTD